MAYASATSGWQRAQVTAAVSLVGTVIVLALYFAAEILIPFALAIFFSFLLRPLVNYVQRRGLGRVVSVVLVTGLTALAVVGLWLLVARQVSDLVADLPNYAPNIKAKARALREAGFGIPTGRIEQMYEEFAREVKTPPPDPARGSSPEMAARPADERPVAVVMKPDSPPWLTYATTVVPSLLAVLAQAGLTFVLVFFMLLKREDMRNRFIRLAGRGHLTVTTRAVDEATHRISRFLLMQFIINAAFGAVLALALWLIGVPYALLWGVIAFFMRYIPYLGTWLGLIFPLALSLFTATGFVQPLLVVGVYLALELGCNNFLEPWLFGSTVGVSEVALLVMAAIWAFIWGPIGLMLSTPLTVVLVVLGKYVPQLEVLDVLLGDTPPLEADVTYYQRLLARDQDEAAQIVQSYLAANPREQVYDALLVAALRYAKRDRERDELSDEDETFVIQATRELMAEIGPVVKAPEDSPKTAVRVLGVAVRDDIDHAALDLFRQLLDLPPGEMEIASEEMLTGEQLELVAERQPSIICLASLPPGGLSQARYLCKRLKARFPDAKILVGRWGLKGNREPNEQQLLQAGADQVAFTLVESRTHLHAWLPVVEREPEPAATP